ncbi:MAG: M48 family metalloprotease [Alphaproteobacteria bacterium]|nr:M48 family metalloprotease [Alphaproteobacteria bacterium]
MFYKLQNWRSVTGGLFHYSSMLALGVGAFATGQWWTLGIAGTFMAGAFGYSLKANKDVLENDLVEHPRAHKYSPNLQGIVDKLFDRSGLDVDKTAVYDFKVTPEAREKAGPIRELLGDMLGKVADTPNAAAFNMGKPVIMISEPLLELLDDAEEEAVLAHEFAHAVAKHQHVAVPHKILSGVIKVSNNLAVLGQLISSGALAIGTSIGAVGLLNKAVSKWHPKGHLLDDANEDSMSELYQRKKLKQQVSLASTGLGVGIVSAFNPLYLTIFGAAKAMNVTANFLEKSFSRNKEYQADNGAVVLGASPLAMITALRKMEAIQKRSIADAWGNEERPKQGVLSKITKEAFATHPAVPKRISRLVGLAKAQGYSSEEIDRAVNGYIDVPDTVNIPARHIFGMAKSFVGADMLAPLAFQVTNAMSLSGNRNKVSEIAMPVAA